MNARTFGHFVEFWTGLQSFTKAPSRSRSTRRAKLARERLRQHLRSGSSSAR